MIKKFLVFWFTGFLVLTIGIEIFAQEELLFMEIPIVYSASKVKEKVTESPVIVTSYKSKDISSFGYYTLADLVGITPGYSSYLIYGEKVFETRGQKAGSWNNNKHLLFIDGIPVNFARNYKANNEEELPLYFADRVELLRGPASCLYGVSAFFGVISIASKGLEEKGSIIENKVSVGDPLNVRRIMNNVIVRSDVGLTKLYTGYFAKDASKAYAGTVDDYNNRFFDDQKSLFMYGSHEILSGPLSGVNIGGIIMSKSGGMGEYWNGVNGGTNEMNEVLWDQIIPYIKYNKQISSLGKLNTYIKANYSTEAALVRDPSNVRGYWNYKSITNNYELSAELNSDIGKEFNIINGINLNTSKETMYSVDKLYELSGVAGNVMVYSWYTQLRKEFPTVLNGNILTLGARYDYGKADGVTKESYNKISPRVGIVQKINENLTVKGSYSEAIRAPGIKEIGLNAESQPNVTYKLKDLKPETISSTEGSIMYTSKKYYGAITYFKNKTVDPLDGASVPGSLTKTGTPVNIFINSANWVEADGYEFENKLILANNFEIFANFSHAMAKDQDNNSLSDIPTNKVNVGIGYLVEGINTRFTLINKWIESYTKVDNTTTDGNNVLDLNIISSVSKNINLELQVKNLADAEYKLPKTGLPDVPMPRRTYIASVNVSF